MLFFTVSGYAFAQTGEVGSETRHWDAVAEDAEALIADPMATKDELEAVRDRVVGVRNEAFEQLADNQVIADELSARLQALGPEPDADNEEPPEIASRRADLSGQYSLAMVPVLRAQEALQRSTSLIADIDRRLIDRISQDLVTRGPSPLLPLNWAHALGEISDHVSAFAGQSVELLRDPLISHTVFNRLPLNLLVIAAGIWIAITLRRWISERVEDTLSEASDPRTIAWALASRNLIRIIFPAFGAGLIFASFNIRSVVQDPESFSVFDLPDFVWPVIGAGWLSGSLFAPRSGAFRPVPLSDKEARSGSNTSMAIGVILSLVILLSDLVEFWGVSERTEAVVFLPIFILGSIALWRLSGLVSLCRTRMMEMSAAANYADENGSERLGLKSLAFLIDVARIVAIGVPVLAAAGYLIAAKYFGVSMLYTLGLIGGCVVVFDLLNKSTASILASPRLAARAQTDGGLGPVVVGFLVVFVAVHILAVIWGARPTDLNEGWRILREGVAFGDFRLSGSGLLKFVVVFGLILGVTRVFQTLLRTVVLPRTRVDVGGRNAVLAGTGYVGWGLAAIAGISAAGFNLTSLAIVAGALSVGIGFGLQTIVSNFVSGIILMIERPIKEGDWIEVAGFAGYVKGIHVRSTEISTFDRASVIVPNSDLIAGTVLNRTHADISGRLAIPVGVAYGSDPRHVERVLLGIIEQHPLVLEDPAPSVLFMDFGADSMNFEIRCYLRDVNFTLTVRSDVNFDIVKQFAKENIEIPFPQRDLHIRSAEGLEGLLQNPGKSGENS